MFDVPSLKVNNFNVTKDYVTEQLGKSHLE
jgi:hypothetical protein